MAERDGGDLSEDANDTQRSTSADARRDGCIRCLADTKRNNNTDRIARSLRLASRQTRNVTVAS
jgi:hypothetical protein